MRTGAPLGKDEFYVIKGRIVVDEPYLSPSITDRYWDVCLRYSLDDAKAVVNVCLAEAAEFKLRFPKWTFGELENPATDVHQFWIDMFDPHFQPARWGGPNRSRVTYEIHTLHEDPGSRRRGLEVKRTRSSNLVWTEGGEILREEFDHRLAPVTPADGHIAPNDLSHQMWHEWFATPCSANPGPCSEYIAYCHIRGNQ